MQSVTSYREDAAEELDDMRGGALQTAENASGVTFDSIFLIIFVFAATIEVTVYLASFGYLGQVPSSPQATNYEGIAVIYIGLIIGGAVFTIFLALLGKARVETGLKNPVSLATWAMGGLGITFLISTTLGLLSTNGPYDLYKFVYSFSVQGPSVLGIITTPLFYEAWIGSNAFGEELFFVPLYLILNASIGRTLPGLVISNSISAFFFLLLHYIKEVLLFGPALTLPTILFLISTVFVRIALNEVAVFSRNFMPAAFGHMAYDIILSTFFGAL